MGMFEEFDRPLLLAALLVEFSCGQNCPSNNRRFADLLAQFERQKERPFCCYQFSSRRQQFTRKDTILSQRNRQYLIRERLSGLSLLFQCARFIELREQFFYADQIGLRFIDRER